MEPVVYAAHDDPAVAESVESSVLPEIDAEDVTVPLAVTVPLVERLPAVTVPGTDILPF